MRQIQASVGLGGHNRPADVGIIQQLLTDAGEHPGPIDRRCGRLTISAIERFQRRVLRRPDGRVDVHGPTWRRLTRTSAATPAPATRHRVMTAPTVPATLPRKAAPAATPATPSGDRRAFLENRNRAAGARIGQSWAFIAGTGKPDPALRRPPQRDRLSKRRPGHQPQAASADRHRGCRPLPRHRHPPCRRQPAGRIERGAP